MQTTGEGSDGQEVLTLRAELERTRADLAHAHAQDLVRRPTFDQIVDWSRFDIFELAGEVEPGGLFVVLFAAIDASLDLVAPLRVDRVAMGVLLRRAQASYEDPQPELRRTSNPYHNALHGADVLVSALSMIDALPARALAPLGEGALRPTPAGQPAPTAEGARALAPLPLFALTFGALLHDFRHRGVSNRFLEARYDELAIIYSGEAVLERAHCARAFMLARETGALEPMHDAEFATLRELVIKMILATDLSHQGMQTVAQVRSLFADAFTEEPARGAGAVEAESTGVDGRERLAAVLSLVVECADLAHPARPLLQHQRWSVLVTEEFHAQGDAETELGLPLSPLCDSTPQDAVAFGKSQRGFIDFVVAPKLRTLATICGAVGRAGDGGVSEGATTSQVRGELDGQASTTNITTGGGRAALWLEHLERNHAFWESHDTPPPAPKAEENAYKRGFPFGAYPFEELRRLAYRDKVFVRALDCTRQVPRRVPKRSNDSTRTTRMRNTFDGDPRLQLPDLSDPFPPAPVAMATDATPFDCKVCGRTFRSATHLRVHSQRHVREQRLAQIRAENAGADEDASGSFEANHAFVDARGAISFTRNDAIRVLEANGGDHEAAFDALLGRQQQGRVGDSQRRGSLAPPLRQPAPTRYRRPVPTTTPPPFELPSGDGRAQRGNARRRERSVEAGDALPSDAPAAKIPQAGTENRYPNAKDWPPTFDVAPKPSTPLPSLLRVDIY